MKVVVKETGEILSDQVEEAKDLFSRIRGLMFKKRMEENEGLLITPCNSIHTCFMNFPIDALFIGKDNRVVHVIQEMKPWRFSSIHFKSVHVLELSGGATKYKVKVGDILEFKNV